MHEAIRSQTAERLGIDNVPDQDAMTNMRLIAYKVFEPVREHFNQPIYISSFYRSPELNRAIGGSSKSQHCTGHAMDIDCDPINDQIYTWIRDNLDFDSMIWEFGTKLYPAWVHVSYKDQGNRRQCLRAYRKDNKTVYELI